MSHGSCSKTSTFAPTSAAHLQASPPATHTRDSSNRSREPASCRIGVGGPLSDPRQAEPSRTEAAAASRLLLYVHLEKQAVQKRQSINHQSVRSEIKAGGVY